MNSLKEIKVTESYMGLDQDIRGCQIEETFDNCTSRFYIENLRKHCECLPFQIRLSNELPLCSSNHSKCVRNILSKTSNCLEPCSGLTVTSFSDQANPYTIESLLSDEDNAAYNEYMHWSEMPPVLKGMKDGSILLSKLHCHFI